MNQHTAPDFQQEYERISKCVDNNKDPYLEQANSQEFELVTEMTNLAQFLSQKAMAYKRFIPTLSPSFSADFISDERLDALLKSYSDEEDDPIEKVNISSDISRAFSLAEPIDHYYDNLNDNDTIISKIAPKRKRKIRKKKKKSKQVVISDESDQDKVIEHTIIDIPEKVVPKVQEIPEDVKVDVLRFDSKVELIEKEETPAEELSFSCNFNLFLSSAVSTLVYPAILEDIFNNKNLEIKRIHRMLDNCPNNKLKLPCLNILVTATSSSYSWLDVISRNLKEDILDHIGFYSPEFVTENDLFEITRDDKIYSSSEMYS